MDPRVKTSAGALEKKFQSEARLASLLSESSAAIFQAGSIREQLEKMTASTQVSASTKDAAEAFGKKLTSLRGAPRGFFAPPSEEITLSRVNGQASTLYGQVWQVDADPTAAQQEALAAVERASADVLKRWDEFKSLDLPALNRLLHKSNTPEIRVDKDAPHEELEGDDE
jgi:hypothetical protein